MFFWYFLLEVCSAVVPFTYTAVTLLVAQAVALLSCARDNTRRRVR